MVAVADVKGVSEEGVDAGLGQFAVLPGEVDFKSVAGAGAGEGTGRPGGGESGQEVHGVQVGLQQHFMHSGGQAEVGINLKRGVVGEEVGGDVLFQQFLQEAVGPVAVVQPGPETDFPGFAPAGASVASSPLRLVKGLQARVNGLADLQVGAGRCRENRMSV